MNHTYISKKIKGTYINTLTNRTHGCKEKYFILLINIDHLQHSLIIFFVYDI